MCKFIQGRWVAVSHGAGFSKTWTKKKIKQLNRLNKVFIDFNLLANQFSKSQKYFPLLDQIEKCSTDEKLWLWGAITTYNDKRLIFSILCVKLSWNNLRANNQKHIFCGSSFIWKSYETCIWVSAFKAMFASYNFL